MTYRTTLTGGRLHGRHIAINAPDEWAAAAHLRPLLDALNEPLTLWTFPVPHYAGGFDLFGEVPTIETITLDEALEALNNHAE
jgi:hypothetical protein